MVKDGIPAHHAPPFSIFSNCCTVPPKYISVRAAQPLKAMLSIKVTLPGSSMLSRDVQWSNACQPISVTPSGIFISESDEQLKNAPLPI